MTAGIRTLGNLPFHEVAALFPLMEGEPFELLKAHGQRETIWTYQGKIIDGRNRYRACTELGILPLTREWNGEGSLVEFVVSLNLHRRHLDSGQRATVAVDMLPLLEAEAKHRQRASGGDKKKPATNGNGAVTQKVEQAPPHRNDRTAAAQAAKLLDTNRQYVAEANKLKETDPENFEKVKAGKVKLQKATQKIKRARAYRAPIYEQLPAEIKVILGDHAVTGLQGEMFDLYSMITSPREDMQKAARLLVEDKAATVREAKRMLRPKEEVSSEAFMKIQKLLPRLTEEDRCRLAALLTRQETSKK
jgi:hypothetical protein